MLRKGDLISDKIVKLNYMSYLIYYKYKNLPQKCLKYQCVLSVKYQTNQTLPPPPSRKEGRICFIYGYISSDMVKEHYDNEKRNPLLFPINSKGSVICTIPQTG